MPMKPPPAPAKGTRHPGAGRKKGTPNRGTVEIRALFGQLLNDPQYQRKLRADFRIRRVHPAVETMVYAYHIGKPKTEIELSGGITLSQRLDGERERLRALTVEQLQELADRSEALITEAFALAADGLMLPARPLDIGVDTLQGKEATETLGKQAESDNTYSVTSAEPALDSDISPDKARG